MLLASALPPQFSLSHVLSAGQQLQSRYPRFSLYPLCFSLTTVTRTHTHKKKKKIHACEEVQRTEKKKR